MASRFFDLARAAAAGQVVFNPCFVVGDTRFEFSTSRPPTEPHKQTASSATVAFGRLITAATNRELGRVVLKMWLTPSFEHNANCGDTEALAYETEVYKFITNQIVLRLQSPNFIPFLGFGACHRWQAETNAPQLRRPLAKLAAIITKYCGGKATDYTRLNVLMTQAGCRESKCTTLSRFSREPPTDHRLVECLSILFVLAYALRVLWSYGIQHNDLHTGNVILNNADPTRPLQIYVVGPNLERDTYIFANTTLPREPVIFDWDRSYVDASKANATLAPNDPNRFAGTRRNTSLDQLNHCRAYGQCNIPNQRFDLYTLLCNLTRGDTGFETVEAVDPELLRLMAREETRRGDSGHACLMYDSNAKRSREPPLGFPTPERFLGYPIFETFLASGIVARGGNHARDVAVQLHQNNSVVYREPIRGGLPSDDAIANYVMSLFAIKPMRN